MRIPSDLLIWAKVYVREKHTTVTQLFIDHLTKLKEKRCATNGKAPEHRRAL